MPQAYYNQPYDDNRVAMIGLVGAKTGTVISHSGYALNQIPFSALGMLSKGALQDMIKGLAKGSFPDSAKGVHRNEWGYLPGNRYAEHATDRNKLTTELYGEAIPVIKTSC